MLNNKIERPKNLCKRGQKHFWRKFDGNTSISTRMKGRFCAPEILVTKYKL